MEWRGGKGRAGQGRVPDCLGGLSRVGISSRSTRPWNGLPPSYNYVNTLWFGTVSFDSCSRFILFLYCLCIMYMTIQPTRLPIN